MTESAPVSGDVLSRLAAFGRLHLLDTVESTNDYALSLADAHSPAVVVARRQTKGRGRYHRPWFSDDSSLTATLLLFTDSSDFPHPLSLVHLAGLSLCRAIEAVTGLSPQIRWPNDVTHKDKKLAGILCEGRKNAVAVGIGLNVNQESFPEDLPDAISVRMATGRTWDKLALLEGFLREMLACVERAGKGEQAGLLAEVKARSAVLHHRVELRTLLRRHVGTVIDLDPEGRVVLRTDSGRLVVLGAGQVRRLR